MASSALPPHDLEAERYLLSAFSLNPNKAVQSLMGVIEPTDFYKPSHRLIFESLLALIEEGVTPDSVTLVNHLHQRGELKAVGGAAGIAETTWKLGGIASNIPRYIKIVTNLARLRDLQSIAREILEGTGKLPDAADASLEALDKIQSVVDSTNKRVFIRTMEDMVNSYLDVLEERQEGRGLGIPTGWKDLDAILQGMRDGELIVIGAAPKVGKSAFAGNLALQVMEQGYRVLLVSIEMAETEIMERLMASRAKVSLSRLRVAELSVKDHERIGKATGSLKDLDLILLDNPNAGLHDIRTTAMRTHPRLIIVDYTQLIQTERRFNGTREREVADLTAALKRLARELHCPVVALSQTKRDADFRRPERSDMAESSSFERNANVILGLYRDEVVNSETPNKGIMEVIVLASRHTKLGVVQLAYTGNYQRIANMGEVL